MHRLEICNKSLLYQSIHWNRLLRYEIRKQISSISTHQSTWLGINLFLNMTTDVKWYYLTWVSTIFSLFSCIYSPYGGFGICSIPLLSYLLFSQYTLSYSLIFLNGKFEVFKYLKVTCTQIHTFSLSYLFRLTWTGLFVDVDSIHQNE